MILGELAWGSARELALGVWVQLADQLSYHTGPDYSLAYPTSILSIKCLVLQKQSCRISRIQGNNRIAERSHGEDLVLIV